MPSGSFPLSLEAAGIIGTWATDVRAGRSVLDEGAAAAMAGDAGLAGQPLTLDVALARIHPEDRVWVFQRILQVREAGGTFSAEYRIRDTAGGVRWVLNQGRLPRPDEGDLGYGTYIDTTHRHALEGQARPGWDEPDMLELAADHCIAAREAIDRSGRPLLRLLIDALLLEIGRHLARRSTH